MSECKGHIWVTTESGTRCIRCDKFASNEADDLRAKLEAVKKEALLYQNNALGFVRDLQKAGEELLRIEQERDNLQAQVKQLSAANDDLKRQTNRRIACQERDELQAQVGVMRGVMEDALPLILIAGNNMDTPEYIKYKQILSTTPAEAGEWVRTLVEALKNSAFKCVICGGIAKYVRSDYGETAHVCEEHKNHISVSSIGDELRELKHNTQIIKALSTTPGQAGERVRAVINAAQAVCDRLSCDNKCPDEGCSNCLLADLRDSLAKYRGETTT